MDELAVGQRVLLEHFFDGLEVIGGIQIADRAIFVVKGLGRIRAFICAFDQMFEHLEMAHHMIAQIHAHETGQLEEPGINFSARARILHWDSGDNGVAEPFDRALHGQIIDAGRGFARVDRAAHHCQRDRAAGVLFPAHERGCGQRRDRGLTHCHHMRAGADEFEIVDQMVDIIIQVERSGAERDHSGIGPIGNVNLCMFHHPLNRAAQQRRKMPAHRGDEQQLGRILGQSRMVEAQQITECTVLDDCFCDRKAGPIDRHRLDIESRFAIGCGGMGEHFQRRRHDRSHAEIAERQGRVVEQSGTERGPGAGGIQPRTLQFMRGV